jgi:hypothetical protein
MDMYLCCAVLLYVMCSCALHQAFDTWRLFKHHVVGFAIRTARKSLEEKWKGLYEIHWTQWSNGNVPGYNLEYNLVFTNAAIFHRELL